MTGPLPENILRCMAPGDRTPMGKAGRTLAECDEANAIKLEKELHRQIEQDLRRRMVTYGHCRMDRKSTMIVGWPDFTFAIKGQAIAVECKAPGGILSDEQSEVMHGLIADGWRYVIAYRLEQVVDLFKSDSL